MKHLSLFCTMVMLFIVFPPEISAQQKVERTVNFPKKLELVKHLPPKNKTWVFIMAGQSNMAGRGFVSPADTLSNPRILSINIDGNIIYAKEPLHFYEPVRTGLDCGMSFARTMIEHVPDDIQILMIPTAVGGSAIGQWLGDSLYRGVNMMTNFKEKVALAKEHGEIKGVLWHQGESDANDHDIPLYFANFALLSAEFRSITGNWNLPILTAGLGSYSKDPKRWKKINNALKRTAAIDNDTYFISTRDLQHKGDQIHFDAEGQRTLGKRFANTYIENYLIE